MADVAVQRNITSTPEALWALVSDVTRMGEWSPETRRCEWVGGATEAVVGAKFKGRNRAGSKTWSTDCQIIAAEPGKEFAFLVTVGPIKVARWGFEFEPDGSTGTVVTETWTDHRNGLSRFLSKFASGVTDRRSHNETTMTETLDRLAAHSEN